MSEEEAFKVACLKCGELKFIAEFNRCSRKSNGLQSYCRKCQLNSSKTWYAENADYKRDARRQYYIKNDIVEKDYRRNYYINNKTLSKIRQLKRYYGITLEEFNDILLNQDYMCALCGNEFKSKNYFECNKDMCVDHDHITGLVRGIIHQKCNRLLGQANEKPEVLRAAADYLELSWERVGMMARELMGIS